MRSLSLIARSVRFYWRTHLSVVLAAAVTSAVLVGALTLGDCVRYTLGDLAAKRLGGVHYALGGQDRFFRTELAGELSAAGPRAAAAVILPGSAVCSDTALRANRVQVVGADEGFWALGPEGSEAFDLGDEEVVLNAQLARRLKAEKGNRVILRVPRPTALSRDVALSPTGKANLPLSVTVRAIITDDQFGRFGLNASQAAPLNAFVSRRWLANKLGMAGKANLLLVGEADGGAEALSAALRERWALADADLHLRPRGDGEFELVSGRVFMDAAIGAAAARADADATGVLTYFVNRVDAAGGTKWYAVVSAVGPLNDAGAERTGPWRLRDGEIAVNTWLAKHLGIDADRTDAKVTLTYFTIGSTRRLAEANREFTVARVVPIAGLAADRSLMPNFPGLSEADTCRQWDASLPIDVDDETKIRPEDEAYWKLHKGTPKAFVSLRAGRDMWASRFGNLTAVRFTAGRTEDELAAAILAGLDPSDVGFTFVPVRAQALAAGAESLDLEYYFLYLSFFLIVAAMMLTGLLFGFGVEQRREEAGTLLAVGFTPARVRRLLLAEGAALAAVGASAGVFGGLAYTRAMLYALATMWRGVSAASAIRYHAEWSTLAVGAGGAFFAAVAAMWIALRKQARSRVRDLLDGTAPADAGQPGRHANRNVRIVGILVIAALTFGIAGLAAHGRVSPAAAAFMLGAVVLLAGLWMCFGVLSAIGRRTGRTRPTMFGLTMRNAGRRRWRSLTVVALLASGCFLVVSIQAFHLDAPGDVRRRESGTGGFVLMGQTATGVFHDLSTWEGRAKFPALVGDEMAGLSIVPLRANSGDDASCLNLNRAQAVRLLGVRPGLLQGPQGQGPAPSNRFNFVAAEGASGGSWSMLEDELSDDAVPAIGDKATIVYGLDKALGETLDYVDDRRRPFKVRIVGIIENSILQGSLVISEDQFVKRFPSSQGHRMFLVDTEGPKGLAAVRRGLSEALSLEGMEMVFTAERLAELNSVQNTYLSIFQALGLLGLLLGSAGVGVVVLRSAAERRAELALLRAVGFSRRRLVGLMFWEHWGLLAMGLAVGTGAAVVGIWPALKRGSAGAFPALTLGLIVAAGTLWVLAGTVLAMRGRLIDALRNE